MDERRVDAQILSSFVMNYFRHVYEYEIYDTDTFQQKQIMKQREFMRNIIDLRVDKCILVNLGEVM